MKTSHCLLAAILLAAAAAAFAADSPQFRGPDRTGVFPESGLLKEWPEGGPEKAWVATGIGRGYSSAATLNGKIYVTGMTEAMEGVVTVLTPDGAVEKTIPYGRETDEQQAPGARSTPTLEGNRLYLLTGLGVVVCLDTDTGAKVWEADVTERFKAEKPTWHYAESLLLDGDNVICTPGGAEAVVAALNKHTGETVWTLKEPQDKAAYCSPVIFTHNGRRILATATGRFIVGADPATGTPLWQVEQKAPWDIHGVSPVYENGLLYYVAGDGAGGAALELSPDGASVTQKWEDKTLDCLHHGVVPVGGHLYGTGYKRGGKLVCLEMGTGSVLWSADEVTLGVTVAADGMLYVYEGPKKGIVSLVKADPSGYVRTGQFTVTDGGDDKHWAHPTIANGHLYIRHGDALVAYRVSAGAK